MKTNKTSIYISSELYAYGVREVVISPGSRSTPLAIAFEDILILRHGYILMNVVQRFALGLIKGSERPVAILCTSGTAAANYTPAIAESQISRIPLIVLTSDRPHELRSVGHHKQLIKLICSQIMLIFNLICL